MDLVAACQAFVSVAERGSFTHGAARLGVSQSVVSRRVAALEAHLGGRVLDRDGRRPAPTVLGSRVLPTARRLADLAETLAQDAEEAHRVAWPLAVPPGWDVRDLAGIDLAGRDHDLPVHVVEAPARQRPELLATRSVHAALLARPSAEATWRVPLGLAVATAGRTVRHLEDLRSTRRGSGGRGVRLWLVEEDDVPHVRDRVSAAADAAGLAPTQVALAPSAGAAVGAVLASRDLLLASAQEASRYDLVWSPLATPALERGYVVAAGVPADADRVRAALGPALARAAGAS
ncbi:helix-turn-helix domain-containing protein [Nocardioides sp. AX2bis]|uniref:helix-turn-helix domain-containing protein n=1 Tax=Nocardioides sp. AX2bis TaxID=2653157 RepID=UPI0012F2FBE0|nr:LysR family transcriptional regulator [Nocardioides sp. AX2bis]VXC09329.1 HTH-type transcriptional regulator BlaA [Nocardioides sp. AX2bis]